MLTALDVHDTLRCGIEQRIDRDVRKQVDLIDVEYVAVGSREQTGAETNSVLFERRAQVDRTNEIVELDARRKFDDLAARFARLRPLAAFDLPGACLAEIGALGVAAVRARRAFEYR